MSKCIVCGVEFERNKKNRTLCSDECRKERSKERDKEYKKEYYKNNKEKLREYGKEYYKNNKEKAIIQRKKYRKNNKEKITKYKKEYNKKNKEKIKEQKKEYRKNNKDKRRDRYNSTPSLRLNSNISSSIRQSLKSNNLSKNGRHWEDMVGYTAQELKSHLESLFTEGMTWDNYGYYGWHVDHIIPQAFFIFTSTDDVEFKYCWSLPNLQPLWAPDNLEKGNKIIF